MFENLPTVPSDDAKVRELQLLRELDRLRKGQESGPTYRAYLEHGMAGVWARLARGDLDAPRDQLEHLKRVRPFVDLHTPELSAVQLAAVDVGAAIECLHLADEAVEQLAVANRVADRSRTDQVTNREVLRVLFNSPNTYFKRGDVHTRLNPTKIGEQKVSPARVGQILDQFYVDGLVLRSMQPGKGGLVGYYSLGPRGHELCKGMFDTSGSNPGVSEYEQVTLPPQQILVAPQLTSKFVWRSRKTPCARDATAKVL
jgi:hypothetical protein